MTQQEIDQLGQQVAAQLWPAEMSLDPDPEPNQPDRAETESASPLVDTIIDRGMSAGIRVSERIRRQIQALVKKKFPTPNS